MDKPHRTIYQDELFPRTEAELTLEINEEIEVQQRCEMSVDDVILI